MDIKNLEPKCFFKYFEEIEKIPRGSGNSEGIKNYLLDFAAKNGLKSYIDEKNNVIIYKDASKGYEESEPLILQGHTDMVCQKKEGMSFDFEKEGVNLKAYGDFIFADGTTLGADDGFAVAMMLSFLEDKDMENPPIEAVFTSDEEIGMLGAMELDMSRLKGKRMINLDAEEFSVITVSCAGGSDFVERLPVKREKRQGTLLSLSLGGMRGGHSGVEIIKNITNADIFMGQVLSHLNKKCRFDIISVNGGTKANAIPQNSAAELLVYDDNAKNELINYLEKISTEVKEKEKDFYFEVKMGEEIEAKVLSADGKDALIKILSKVPDGIIKMSDEIEGLVETSLNLGILETDDEEIKFHHALRSNKKDCLMALCEKMVAFSKEVGAKYEAIGHYPPWEYNDKSHLQDVYKKVFHEKTGREITTEAIHAGLECGVFAKAIKGFDAIAVGADIFDVHTIGEKMSISSVQKIHDILKEVIKNLK